MTTAELIRHWAKEQPDHPALRWADGQLTYQELDERSNRVAQALKAAGVGEGDHVAYLDKNSPEQLELFYGAAKLNAVPTPVNFRLAPPEIAVIVADAEAKVFAVARVRARRREDRRRPARHDHRRHRLGSPFPSYADWRTPTRPTIRWPRRPPETSPTSSTRRVRPADPRACN
jgi:acyl-CoA synthetase (AMP-forming)/AMP-acid ligase II